VQPSLAPSMDIQVASNFERFLYLSLDRDTTRVRAIMEEFRRTGKVSLGKLGRDGLICSSRCSDGEIPGVIGWAFEEYGYIVDPHTACGFMDLAKDRVSVVLATAHPAKFPDLIGKVTELEPLHQSLEDIKELPLVKHKIKADPAAIKAFIRKHGV